MPNSQCWFCGAYIDRTYYCNKCNQLYCETHKEPIDHDCISIIEMNPEYLAPAPIEILYDAGVSVQSSAPEVYFPSNGRFELDENVIDTSIRNLIQYYLDSNGVFEQGDELELIKLMKRNPSGQKLISEMKVRHHLVEGLLTWLKTFGTPSHGMNELSRELQIPLKDLSFRKIIKLYYSTLSDASYLDKITGKDINLVDNISGKPIIESVNVKVHGSIAIGLKTLTDISEHARQSGERESSGYLIGKRNSDMSILEITNYEPIMLGGEQGTIVDLQSMVKIMSTLEGIGKKIVGFVHSHPYIGVPCYSYEDKKTHVKITAGLSIFEYLLLLDTNIPKDFLFKISMYLSQFNLYQIKFLLEAVNSTFSNALIFNEITTTISKQNPDTWSILESQIQSILHNYKIETVPVQLNLIPQAGVVICPWRRQIGIIDCIYEESPQNPELPVKEWFYYRIAIKKEQIY